MKPKIVLALVLVLVLGRAQAATFGSLYNTSSVPTTAEIAASNYVSATSGTAGQVFYANGSGGGSWGDASSPTSGITQAAAEAMFLEGDDAVYATVASAATNLYVNAKNYGAVGDNSTDDTTSLQAAVDAAEESSMPLYIPAGTYKLTSPIYYTNGVDGAVIMGAGEGRTIINQTTSSADCFVYTVTNDINGLAVSDITFQGANGTGDGFVVAPNPSNVARVSMRNVTMINNRIGANLEDIDQSTFMNCSFSSNNDTGVRLDGNINAVNFIGGVINVNATNGMHIVSGRGVNLVGVDIGSTSGLRYIYNESGTLVTLKGCTFEIYIQAEAAIRSDTGVVSAEACIFQGFSTAPTNPPIRLAVNTTAVLRDNIVTGTYASGTPQFKMVGGRADVTGSYSSPGRTATVPDGRNGLDENGNYFRLSLFPTFNATESVNTNLATRGLTAWKRTYGSSQDDDLVVVWMQGSDGTYHISSLINSHMLSSSNIFTSVQTFNNGINVDSGNIDLQTTGTGDLLLGDYNDIDYATTTDGSGFKISKESTDKMGFWGATPVDQPAANADTSGNDAAANETEINELKALLREVGFMAP